MLKSLLSVVLVAGCLYGVSAEDQCMGEQDPTVYSFGHSYSDFPYEYLTDDGEPAGLAFDLVRSVCKIMNKQCTQAVYYDYSIAWDGDKSLALNNRWYDVLPNWFQTTRRVAAYGFVGEFSKQDNSYMYVRKGSSLDSVDEVRKNANSFGFRLGFYTDPACLARNLGISMDDLTIKYYDTTEDLVEALDDRKVDVIFGGTALGIDRYDDVSRVGDEPYHCAKAGASMMTRKDMVGKFAWFDEGMEKLHANGDYAWLCNINSNEVDPNCL